jgi:hypothetical protein
LPRSLDPDPYMMNADPKHCVYQDDDEYADEEEVDSPALAALLCFSDLDPHLPLSLDPDPYMMNADPKHCVY